MLSDPGVSRTFVVDLRLFCAVKNIFWYSYIIDIGGNSLPKHFEHNLKIRSHFWMQFRILQETKRTQNLAEFFFRIFHDSRKQRYATLSFYSFIYSPSAKKDCVLPVI